MKNPRKGWMWEEFGVTVRESSPDRLARRVGNMRSANGMDPGDPMADICRELASTDPWLVLYRETDKNAVQKQRDPFAGVVEKWTFSYLTKPASFCHIYDSKQRAEICEGCPHNQKIEFGSPSEEERYWRSLMIASRGQCERFPKLGACRHHGHDNRLAVFLESVDGKTYCCGQGEDQPAHCWL